MVPPAATPGDPRPLLTLEGLALLLVVSRTTLRTLRAAGRIPAPLRALGERSPRWDPRVIDRWIAAGMPPAERFEELERTRGGRA